jgi:prepilin-type N-terminal cleavage/methylation domain-containing protein
VTTAAAPRRVRADRRPAGGGRATRGFTLIEMLVVLTIVAMLAGLVTPVLFRLARRFEISAQRQQILVDLAQLGYRAYLTGQPLTLGQSAESGTVLGAIPATPTPTPALTLPEGWVLEAKKPITYSFGGICSGGAITLIDPDKVRHDIRMKAPRCKPEFATNG